MTSSSAARTVVLGAGGLLGRAVVAAVRRHRGLDEFSAPSIAWSDPPRASRQLADLARSITAGAGPWRVIWCAGAGVNGTTRAQFETEVNQFEAFLDAFDPGTATAGHVFLASSAGGVYAGAGSAPFTEASPLAPISEYGAAKLSMEERLHRFASRTGTPILIGRFSNLYGPGQNLDKQQGLISHLCLGAIERRPVSIFVPLDTIRDYLYVHDAALMLLDAVDMQLRSGQHDLTKIFAAQQGTTIATLISTVNASVGAKPPIVLGSSSLSAYQSLDLRMRSTVLTDIDSRVLTSLAVGVARTRANLLALYTRSGRRRV